MLLEYYYHGDGINLKDNNGMTALMYACKNSNTTSSEKTVRQLLEYANININLENKDGLTALMLAKKYQKTNSNIETINILTQYMNRL